MTRLSYWPLVHVRRARVRSAVAPHQQAPGSRDRTDQGLEEPAPCGAPRDPLRITDKVYRRDLSYLIFSIGFLVSIRMRDADVTMKPEHRSFITCV